MTGMPLLILVAAVGFPVLVMAALVFLGIRRRARLSRRDPIDFEDWAGRLSIGSVRSLFVCGRVVKALAEQLGIEVAQLRPEDSFDSDFAMAPPWVGMPNPLVEEFLDEVARILREEGARNWPRFRPRGRTLGDLLLSVDQVLGGVQATGTAARDCGPAEPTARGTPEKPGTDS